MDTNESRDSRWSNNTWIQNTARPLLENGTITSPYGRRRPFSHSTLRRGKIFTSKGRSRPRWVEVDIKRHRRPKKLGPSHMGEMQPYILHPIEVAVSSTMHKHGPMPLLNKFFGSNSSVYLQINARSDGRDFTNSIREKSRRKTAFNKLVIAAAWFSANINYLIIAEDLASQFNLFDPNELSYVRRRERGVLADKVNDLIKQTEKRKIEEWEALRYIGRIEEAADQITPFHRIIHGEINERHLIGSSGPFLRKNKIIDFEHAHYGIPGRDIGSALLSMVVDRKGKERPDLIFQESNRTLLEDYVARYLIAQKAFSHGDIGEVNRRSLKPVYDTRFPRSNNESSCLVPTVYRSVCGEQDFARLVLSTRAEAVLKYFKLAAVPKLRGKAKPEDMERMLESMKYDQNMIELSGQREAVHQFVAKTSEMLTDIGYKRAA